MSRRELLELFGLGALAAAGCATGPPCGLSSEQSGSSWIDLPLVRSDLREGQAGAALAIAFTVIDGTTCEPLPGAAVDLWNANPQGLYSGQASAGTAGQTYLRGVQVTDANGRVNFTTLYPGWYAQRTCHLHVKVHVGAVSDGGYADGTGRVCHTGQLFFPQAFNDAIRGVAPYDQNPNPYVTNAADSIFTGQNGVASLLAIGGTPAAGFSASTVLAVDPGATHG